MSRLILILLLALALTACGGAGPNAGRYALSQDRAPKRAPHPDSIADAELLPFTRTEAGNTSPYTLWGQQYYVMETEEDYRARGTASWYGMKFDGHLTANGEVFDMYKATAAHKTLPIPSYLRVTNLDNGRRVIVRVNDRGPFHGGRLVDLSYGAAVKLGFAESGTARVLLEALIPGRDSAEPRPTRDPESVGQVSYLQVGAFWEKETADQQAKALSEMTAHRVSIEAHTTERQDVLYRVRVGPLEDAGELRELRDLVVAAGFENPYTVRY